MKKFNFTAMIPQVILFSFVFWENPGDHKLLLRFNDGKFNGAQKNMPNYYLKLDNSRGKEEIYLEVYEFNVGL
jgi:hypothetical protein